MQQIQKQIQAMQAEISRLSLENKNIYAELERLKLLLSDTAIFMSNAVKKVVEAWEIEPIDEEEHEEDQESQTDSAVVNNSDQAASVLEDSIDPFEDDLDESDDFMDDVEEGEEKNDESEVGETGGKSALDDDDEEDEEDEEDEDAESSPHGKFRNNRPIDANPPVLEGGERDDEEIDHSDDEVDD